MTPARIPGALWRHLQSNAPHFEDHWGGHRPEAQSLMALTAYGYRYGFNDEQVKTMLTMFQTKFRRRFDAADWERNFREAGRERGIAHIPDDTFFAYRDSVIEIETDPAHVDYSKLWISYAIVNCEMSLDNVAQVTGLPMDVIARAVKELADSKKLEKMEDGLYRAVSSFYWDKPSRFPSGEVPPEMLSGAKWHQEMLDDETGANEIFCFDVRIGKHARVLYDRGQSFSSVSTRPYSERHQRIIDHDGRVTTRVTGWPFALSFNECMKWNAMTYVSGDSLDCRMANLIECDVDDDV